MGCVIIVTCHRVVGVFYCYVYRIYRDRLPVGEVAIECDRTSDGWNYSSADCGIRSLVQPDSPDSVRYRYCLDGLCQFDEVDPMGPPTPFLTVPLPQ